MEPVYFVLAILGCDDDGAQCRQQRVEPVRYQSVMACQAAMPAVLERSTDLAFPVIGGSCEQRGQQMAGTSASRLGSRGG
ncbi:MAG: hypothetical protein WDN44_08170 [Sphingomonas sp.]